MLTESQQRGLERLQTVLRALRGGGLQDTINLETQIWEKPVAEMVKRVLDACEDESLIAFLIVILGEFQRRHPGVATSLREREIGVLTDEQITALQLTDAQIEVSKSKKGRA